MLPFPVAMIGTVADILVDMDIFIDLYEAFTIR